MQVRARQCADVSAFVARELQGGADAVCLQEVRLHEELAQQRKSELRR